MCMDLRLKENITAKIQIVYEHQYILYVRNVNEHISLFLCLTLSHTHTHTRSLLVCPVYGILWCNSLSLRMYMNMKRHRANDWCELKRHRQVLFILSCLIRTSKCVESAFKLVTIFLVILNLRVVVVGFFSLFIFLTLILHRL